MTWHDYVDENDEAVIEFADWLGSLHPAVQKDLVSRIDALEELASFGEIELPEDGSPGDLDAIQRDPDLYELRWTLLTKQVRQYHGEPTRFPDALIRLHLHIKGDRSRYDPANQAKQEQEILKTRTRYHDGESRNWDIS